MSRFGRMIIHNIDRSRLISDAERTSQSMLVLEPTQRIATYSSLCGPREWRSTRRRFPFECCVSQSNDRTRNNSSTSSSFHQKYQRQNYERKRNQSFNDGTRHSGHDNNTNDIAGSSIASQQTHYQRLNIDSDADAVAIKSSYYALSKLYHPDKVGSDDSQANENFRMITEAYDVLSDPKTRAEYDKEIGLSQQILNSIRYGDSAHPNKDFSLIFKRQDTFLTRAQQEASFERDKMLNPRRYRPGTLKSERIQFSNANEVRSYIDQIDRQIRAAGNQRFEPGNDNSSFYRMHLIDTLNRRREGLENHYMMSDFSASKESAPIGVVLITIAIGAITLLATIGGDLIKNFDEKLERQRDSERSD